MTQKERIAKLKEIKTSIISTFDILVDDEIEEAYFETIKSVKNLIRIESEGLKKHTD